MRGTLALLIIALQLLVPLSLFYVGFRLWRTAKRLQQTFAVFCISIALFSFPLALISHSFGGLDRLYLHNLAAKDVRFFYIGNTMIEDASAIERVTHALHSIEPCFPNENENPIPSFVIFEDVGYHWWRMHYWSSTSQDTIILYFGRGRDDNRPQLVEGYGCSSELATVLHDLGISWDS